MNKDFFALQKLCYKISKNVLLFFICLLTSFVPYLRCLLKQWSTLDQTKKKFFFSFFSLWWCLSEFRRWMKYQTKKGRKRRNKKKNKQIVCFFVVAALFKEQTAHERKREALINHIYWIQTLYDMSFSIMIIIIIIKTRFECERSWMKKNRGKKMVRKCSWNLCSVQAMNSFRNVLYSKSRVFVFQCST